MGLPALYDLLISTYMWTVFGNVEPNRCLSSLGLGTSLLALFKRKRPLLKASGSSADIRHSSIVRVMFVLPGNMESNSSDRRGRHYPGNAPFGDADYEKLAFRNETSLSGMMVGAAARGIYQATPTSSSSETRPAIAADTDITSPASRLPPSQ